MADPTSQAISQGVATVATPIKDTIFEYVKRHSSYLFSYKGKINKLQEQVEELCQKRERIQAKVDRAQDSAQDTYVEVSSWLNQVQATEQEVDDFLANESKENKQCFKCTCPNIIWRYRLGKGAEEKTKIVANLKEKGGKLELTEVAQPARFPPEVLETPYEDYVKFGSRYSTFTKILEALEDSNVKMILVHGPGGVGKTRMVNEVTKQVKKGELFEQVARATISQEPNVKDIQDQLAAQLNLKFDRDDIIGRKGQLYNRLKHTKKKVLVIMDDVWKKEDMEGIGVPFTDCKILVTSRYEGLCDRKPDQKEFSIGVLEEMEAWELFKRTTKDISESDFVAREVCKECGGLPLAILAVGATLKGKRTHAWKDALQKLKNANMPEIPGISPKIYTSLKLSYDNLNHVQKSLFLLFCLFPEDAEVSIDNLVRCSMALQLLSDVETLDQARDNVLALVEYLKSSNLLLNGKNEYFAKMHDIIRDVAIYITKRKEPQTKHDSSKWPESQQFLVKHNIQKWPEKGTWESSSAISLRLCNVNVELPSDCCCPELHTLILELGMLKLPLGFFGGMEKLTVLVLIRTSMLSLPPSLASLVNLRMLFLNSCELAEMNVLKDLKDSIEILNLTGSTLEVLPSEICQLTRLRLLDLICVEPLQVIPKDVFSNLLNLEELYVPNTFKNWGCDNLGDEIKSSQLTTLHIHVLEVHLIKNLPFERLTRFKILVGDGFDLRSDYFSSTTRVLRISGVHIKNELKILLERTEELHLTRLQGLKCLDHLLGEPKYSSSSFSKLTALYIQDCGFKYLLSPSCARSLYQLQCLEIKDCQNLEFIVGTNLDGMETNNNDDVILLPRLRDLILEGLKIFKDCPKLEEIISIPEKVTEANTSNDGVTTFYALESLCLKNLPNFRKIYSSLLEGQCLFNHQVSCPVLEALTIVGLENIIKIWEVESKIQLPSQLSSLWIKGCPKIEVIISIPVKEKEATASNNDVITFPTLDELTLEELPNFKRFYSSSMEGQYLFNHQILFPVLEHLTIGGLMNIMKIWEVESMILLPSQLQSLDIQDCPKMEMIISISEKEKEAITSNNDMFTFPALHLLHLVGLPNFKKFYSSMPEEVWSDTLPINSFSQLTQVTLRDCNKLTSVASSSIGQCDSLQVIIRTEGWNKAGTNAGEFMFPPQLLQLEIEDLPSLESFFSEPPLFQLPSTVELIEKNCPKWRHVPTC
ncbi:hypothetical protein NMG60_11002908 [Bertholletia excelsa]